MVNITLFSSSFFLLFTTFLLLQPPLTTCNSAVYFSKTTFFNDYQKMMNNFKIFVYPPPSQEPPQEPPLTTTNTFSLLHDSLLSSPFITYNPNQATLFFLPFLPLPTRDLTRHIQDIRTSYPYWNSSLGADHFYFSCEGVGPSASRRNVVELKKNSIQISCFPSPAREFIPHKDVTLPPVSTIPRASDKRVKTRLLGYWRYVEEVQSGVALINGLKNDAEFLIESKPSDEEVYLKRMKKSKFCLFVNDNDEGMAGLSVALEYGCVPVVITDRPIQDLPLMDVIKWSEIALFVGSNIEPDEFKRALIRTCEDGGYKKMKNLGVASAYHFAWNESSPQPYDAFYMVMYQLWRRRHTIRYSKWNMESLAST